MDPVICLSRQDLFYSMKNDCTRFKDYDSRSNIKMKECDNNSLLEVDVRQSNRILLVTVLFLYKKYITYKIILFQYFVKKIYIKYIKKYK